LLPGQPFFSFLRSLEKNGALLTKKKKNEKTKKRKKKKRKKNKNADGGN